MAEYLYKVIVPDSTFGDRHFYRYEEAMKCFEREGTKIYAYTKDLKPIYILLRWK